MTRFGVESLGAALLAQRELEPLDDATRLRLAELVVNDGEVRRPPRLPVEPEIGPDVTPQAETADSGLSERLVGGASGLASSVGSLAQAATAWLVSRWAQRDEPIESELSVPERRGPTSTAGKTLDPPKPGTDLDVESLFVPRWIPGILGGALSFERADGPVDIGRLVEHLARRDIPSRIPRLQRRSVTSGAQVLVDLSEDMIPFRDDIVEILERIRLVLGGEHVAFLRFAEKPLSEIGPGRRDSWTRYEPPDTPRPVLIVSNFRQSAATFQDEGDDYHREMASLIREAEAADCVVVALVPNAASRMPEPLRRRVRVVEWDRPTTAAAAARVVRR
jgi:hypothetical protein